ncbi:polyisoprenyl-teichoic acid--peptidoglycan teichoic acid transferase TagU [Lederbergia lenta]|uniref:Polyisoprenyl-teichoic acid--peptidoglycan teichoic acid transferase TagU n=1 Tax=Lederbergia lenta TaxID=1467 RepID=A0A2X4ZQG5_LEDLE|nr:LytR family transcriptional regulator [Lederbergia lenta]MCM3111912.1 LytR family transcriptional regulator [Lederbergia lenta]MEC2323067.1 LytR family transcriptional regulator [Lederbergia lenta]SQI62624.1 membrane-bound protein transcriptional regulator LytR [Lederbergia lenta]
MARHKTKKKRKGLKIFLIVLLLLVVGVVAYGYSIYHNLNKAANTVHSPINRTPEVKRPTELALNKQDPFSVLMLGVDERPGDKGRSDTMIVMTVNPEKQSMEMLSIPRDTRVEIVGRGTEDKINHSYAFGGVEMSMNTVEKFLDIPIDYYVKMNMDGFKEIVDAVGGITVNNDLDFSQGGHHFAKGQLNLNGKEALSYARMRKSDSRGDFGRQMRQRQVIQGVMNKGANVSALWKYDDVLKALSNNVETNISFDEMKDIQKNYSSARHNIEQMQIEGSGSTIGGVWYYIVSQDERDKIQTRLKEHLKLQ